MIDINKIKNKITKKTKAVISVNLYGQKVDLNYTNTKLQAHIYTDKLNIGIYNLIIIFLKTHICIKL